jgi:hypothetical protein
MLPRCFLAIGGSCPRRTGGEIFSKVKTGIVHPLVVELKHPWTSSGNLFDDGLWQKNRANPSNAGAAIQA